LGVTWQESLKLFDSEQLPQSDQVDVEAFSQIFSKTTTSYKYLFLLSLLELLKQKEFEVLAAISFRELIVEMLAKAWYPHTCFQLSFGTQDKIVQKLDALNLAAIAPQLQLTNPDQRLLRKTIASQDLTDSVNHLRRYVPFRVIAPFLREELNREKVSQGTGNDLEKAIPAIAAQYFNREKPLYKFDAIVYRDCQSVLIHPDWATYLETHYTIVQEWVGWKWAEYKHLHKINYIFFAKIIKHLFEVVYKIIPAFVSGNFNPLILNKFPKNFNQVFLR
jgi:hypothetical protein